jgi:Fanconi-associated nuclease 1
MLQWRSKQPRPSESSVDDHPRKKPKLSNADLDTDRYDTDDSRQSNLEVVKGEPEPDLPIRLTGLESALGPIDTDQDAIDEYESSQAAKAEAEETADDESLNRLKSRKWIRGMNSIYVDAFNVALDTVLEEEAHLFNEAEHTVFQTWKDLSYQAQYL